MVDTIWSTKERIIHAILAVAYIKCLGVEFGADGDKIVITLTGTSETYYNKQAAQRVIMKLAAACNAKISLINNIEVI